MQGRVGEQFMAYHDSIVQEMYQILGITEDKEEVVKNADAFSQLFLSLREKKKFSLYSSKIERYQKQKCMTMLRIAKLYYPEDMIVPAIGRNERVNIAEFKNTNPLSVEIKLKEQNKDIEGQYGRQLVMNTALQYVGNKLEREDIGRIIRNMPFGNMEESFSDLTLDYDMGTNLILALDRGEMPSLPTGANAKYLLKRLDARVMQSDFKFLDPMIQQNYEQAIVGLQKKEALELEKIKAAESDFIPSGGAKIKADYYVEDPTNPNKVSRATLPAEAVDWLIKRLAEQGTSQQSLQMQTQGTAAEIAGLVKQNLGIPPETQRIPSPQVSEAVQ
jgi:hypothetical protein